MTSIKIVDARMGRGKSSAAIRYMNQHKWNKRFLYITPYLDEVGRICERCDFDQPDKSYISKSSELKIHLRQGHNIAVTHSLFYLMDNTALELIRERRYSLIVDESIQVIRRLNITDKDFDLVTGQLADVKEGGSIVWRDDEYAGRFYDYKEMADTGSLFKLDSALMNILNPELIRAFDEVFVLTYLFAGQYLKAYLDFFGFDYKIIGIEQDDLGYYFSGNPDSPPPLDYTELIHIADNKKLNAVGDTKFALSKSWYDRRGYNNPEIKAVRNGMKRFFQSIDGGSSESRMWTCYKNDVRKLVDAKTGRFRKNFVQTCARATNRYRDRTDAAYLVNRFVDPNIMKFFRARDVSIDSDTFALSEMIQWIWRSAVRDDKPINLYIPSRRMRELLINWMNDAGKGR